MSSVVITKEELQEMLEDSFCKGVEHTFNEMIDLFQSLLDQHGSGAVELEVLIKFLEDSKGEEGETVEPVPTVTH